MVIIVEMMIIRPLERDTKKKDKQNEDEIEQKKETPLERDK